MVANSPFTPSDLQAKLYDVIFGTDTPLGKRFDIVLICLILLSVLALMFDSMAGFSEQWQNYLYVTEWAFTLVFTLEYMVRIYCSPKPLRYIFSFYGVVDFISVLPSYLSLFIAGARRGQLSSGYSVVASAAYFPHFEADPLLVGSEYFNASDADVSAKNIGIFHVGSCFSDNFRFDDVPRGGARAWF